MATTRQMITFRRGVTASGRYRSQAILCNLIIFCFFHCWKSQFSDAHQKIK